MIEPSLATHVAKECFGLSGTASALSGERDLNFKLVTPDGRSFVLKVAPADEDRERLEQEATVMTTIQGALPGVQVPEPVSCLDGTRLAEVTMAGEPRLVRVQTFLPGRIMAARAPYSDSLLRSVGRAFGRLDVALQNLSVPARSPAFPWDLTRAPERVRACYDSMAREEHRALLGRFLRSFETVIPERLDGLPQALIHNDGNERNILVDGVGGDARVSGILDFGDMLRGPRVVEPAVCAAYASLETTNPLRAATAVVAGYHEVATLREEEIAVLYPLLVARLCLSVSVSTSRHAQIAANPYLAVSEQSVWAALRRWTDVHPRLAEATFRSVCGLQPVARVHRVRRWLEENGRRAAPVIAPRSGTEVMVLDLSPGSSDPCADVSPRDPRFATVVDDRMRDEGVNVAYGRYAEPRRVYAAEQFGTLVGEVEDVRTVHMGIDIFSAAGTPVNAPFDGVVHSVADNDLPLDYGPTVILQHETDDGDEFFTLYGHLSRASVSAVSPGRRIARGERIADLGAHAENGGWPPHLHIQLISDLFDKSGDFPGVCQPWCLDAWTALCPDPNLVLGVPTLAPAPGLPSAGHLTQRRRFRMGASLSVSYQSPLHIVRGEAQYLFDQWGRRYLDGVNNVCHVGHCHPTVVRAVARQAALLNTNTRYLHELILNYAERLAATLPSPLEVCFFTNSGSEANELALRMAHAHSGGTDTIVLDGAYHGNTSALVAISPYKFDGPGGAGRPRHVHVVPTPDLYRGKYRDAPDAGARYAAHVHQAIDAIRADGRSLSAFIAEPIMSCAGQVPLADGFLSEVFTTVRAAGGVCIADEVQTGFARVGSHMWAFEMHGTVPDIVTMGKPIGNGHPLGAVVTTREIAASFANGMEYFNTFGGNPVACAAGLAVMDILEGERLQDRAKHIGAMLMSALRGMAERHDAIGDVRGSGLFLGIELVRDRVTRSPSRRQASYVVERMKQKGVLLSTDGPDGNVIKIKPPLVWDDVHARQLLDGMEAVLGEPGFSSEL